MSEANGLPDVPRFLETIEIHELSGQSGLWGVVIFWTNGDKTYTICPPDQVIDWLETQDPSVLLDDPTIEFGEAD